MNNETNIPQPAYSEIDIPLEVPIPAKKLDKKQVDNLEKVNQIALKNFMTQNGLRLLIGILVVMLLLVVADTVVVNFGFTSSEFLTTVIDFGKYIATTLLGFLFAHKTNDRE